MDRPGSHRHRRFPAFSAGARSDPASGPTARLLLAALVAAAALAVPAGAGAQEAPSSGGGRAPGDSTATLMGKVVSAMTGGPLPGARVVLKTSGYGAITDSTGDFRIRQVPAGFVDTIQVNLIGYANQSIPLRIKPGSTTRAETPS